MATFSHIGGAEPSTLTFKVRTIQQTQNSSAMQQEIISIGDPDSSAAVTAVLNAAPASTAWGIVTREVASRFNIGSTAADNAVSISGNSTAIQGTNPWVVGFPAGYLSSGVQAGGSSAVTVRNVWSSTNTDQPVSAAQAGTWTVSLAANSSLVQLNAIAAGYVSTAVPTAGSSGLNVWLVGGNRLNIGSTAADNAVTATIGTNLQSTVAGSSNSSALLTRPIIDTILTVASSNAFASTSLTIQSSAAGIRSYVTAYSILSTAAGPTAVKFYDGSSMIWPIVLAAVSSAVSGANLAVSAPAYIFRGSQANALTLQVASSVAGFKVGVSYFRAP